MIKYLPQTSAVGSLRDMMRKDWLIGMARQTGRIIRCTAALLAFGLAARAETAPAPIEVRVVVVTAFEIGEDTGDQAGEFQAWAEEMPVQMPFPLGYRHLRYDPVRKVLAVATGEGTSRAAISTMALGLDPRFDLSHAYWLIAAIAGVNPDEGSIGSAAWIGDVIDIDYNYDIDSREIPAGWPTGIVPRGRKAPYALPVPDTQYNLFRLNHDLRDWAFRLTKDTVLPDNDGLRTSRARYVGWPKALEPPKVFTGDEVSGQSFTHGRLINEQLEKWVSYWTGGEGRFAMKAEEDSGVFAAVQRLEQVGRADSHRVMALRTASNYHMQPPGIDAAASLFGPMNFAGFTGALVAAHLVGERVLNEIAGHWSRYRDKTPDASPDK